MAFTPLRIRSDPLGTGSRPLDAGVVWGVEGRGDGVGLREVRES